jgi:HEAT repeat protein
MRYFLLSALIFFIPAFFYGNESYIRKIQSHMILCDYMSAIEECKEALIKNPDNKQINALYVKALAFNEEERKAIDHLENFLEKYKLDNFSKNLIEDVSWRVLLKGISSDHNFIKFISLIGVGITNDARAVDVLISMLRDSNAVLRSIAVQFACNYRDYPLKKEIMRLFKEERVWFVKLEIIKAIGLLKIEEAKEQLQKIIQNNHATFEEKEIAIDSLVKLYDDLSLEEFNSLVKSPCSGLRELACFVAGYLKKEEMKEGVKKLLSDPIEDVKVAALKVFGTYFYKTFSLEDNVSLLEMSLSDNNPKVSIVAAWACYKIDTSLAKSYFDNFFKSESLKIQRMAAVSLASTGKKGVVLSKHLLDSAIDPYVRINLALGLLGQKENVNESCRVIEEFLDVKKELCMWQEKPFRGIFPSKVIHLENIPNYPTLVDEHTQLNLLSILTMNGNKSAKKNLEKFLKKKTWGLAGSAAIAIIQEGDEESINLIKQILENEDKDIKLQAALILAIVGKEDSAIPVLQELYQDANRDVKLRILEALGYISTPQNIEFLVQILKDPFQVLRVIDATAIIQSLNR